MEPVSNVNRQGYLFGQPELRLQISNTLTQQIKGRKASISGEGGWLKEKKMKARGYMPWRFRIGTGSIG